MKTVEVKVNVPEPVEPTVTVTMPLKTAFAILDVAGYAGDVSKMLTDDPESPKFLNPHPKRDRNVHFHEYRELHSALVALWGPLGAVRQYGYRA